MFRSGCRESPFGAALSASFCNEGGVIVTSVTSLLAVLLEKYLDPNRIVDSQSTFRFIGCKIRCDAAASRAQMLSIFVRDSKNRPHASFVERPRDAFLRLQSCSLESSSISRLLRGDGSKVDVHREQKVRYTRLNRALIRSSRGTPKALSEI